ncbi:galactitol-1-phosphate 5-dehydrogenase [Ideonella sp. A 288]|uniref:galactitol-1-phosphate 5-dehydrogenase n=1 Tax=Ideonella sp. A 288 TaxID=1962181 RepID=UPI000B4AE66F|nr:galactitol-1-phosphate 5-dehydrogenase [Ideonella sp. A 288]
MKALVYTQPNEVQLLDRPEPTMVPGDVVLRIDAVGICGSDMHAYHGHDPRRKPGLVLGHEFSGTVVSSMHPLWQEGMRATGNPLIVCGHCEYCVQGRDNLCAHRTMVGMTRPGAFAQQMGIPAGCLIPLPDSLGSVEAALTEPGATALHAINLSMKSLVRPLPECRVLVLGGGAIGMLAALLLRHYGVDRLAVAEVNPLRRTSIEQHARCATFDPIAQGPEENAFDYVIDAVGSARTRQSALAAVKPGGVVMHIGLQDWASEIDMRKLTLAEITLLGTYTYSTADLRATVAALARGVFGDLSWVERRPLADGARAFDDLHHGRVAAAKLVLEPQH